MAVDTEHVFINSIRWDPDETSFAYHCTVRKYLKGNLVGVYTWAQDNVADAIGAIGVLMGLDP